MFAAIAFSIFLNAQSAAPVESLPALTGRETDLIEVAQRGARLAGAAYYCKADIEDVDLLVSRVEGLLAAKAADKAQAVFAKVEFKNLLTAARSKEPTVSCTEVARKLLISLQTIG